MEKKLNILFFKFAVSFGGGEKFGLLVARKMKEIGHDIFFFTNNNIFLKKLKKEKINSKKIYWGHEIGARRYIPEYFFLLPINLIRFFFIFIFYKKNGYQNIVVLQNLSEKIFATNLARFLGFKVFWVEHLSVGPWLSNNYFKNSYIKKSNQINKLIVISEEIKKGLIQIGVDAEKIEVVYNGVDTNEFKVFSLDIVEKEKKKYNLPKESRIIGYVGRLHEEKGLDLLIDVFSKLNNKFNHLYLLFIGDGPERKKLEEKVSKLSLEKKVFFLGHTDDVPLFLNILDIFVLPSKVRESFGMVLIEAMACGKPVIGSNLGGIPEIIKNGFNGLLFEPSDSNQLEEAISSLLNSKGLLNKLSINAINDVRNKFSLDATVNKMEKIFKNDNRS